MIVVDIYVPIMGKSYDFSLDENAQIAAIIEEVSDIICQKEHWTEKVKTQGLILSCPQIGCILAPSESLRQRGIRTGYRLLLT